MNTFLKKTSFFVQAHKVWTAVIIVAVAGGGYYAYKTAKADTTVTTYTLSTVANGTVITTVTGTGQVSADNDQDVASQVAGTVDSIPVAVGQSVKAGDILAHIDSTSAEQSLESAQLSYDQLTEPAKAADLQNDQDAVEESYSNAWSAVANTFSSLPTMKDGLDTDLYGLSGYLSNVGPNEEFIDSNPTAESYYETAARDYDQAASLYQTAYGDFEAATANDATEPASSTVKELLNETLVASSALSKTAADSNTLLSFITDQDTLSNTKSQSESASTLSELQSWSASLTSLVSSLGSDQNNITSNENALATLVEGADSLAVEASELQVTQAEQNYGYTNVRAPFDGIVAKIDVTPQEQVSNGTTVATVVTTEEYATISLNEVDAAKVSVGQKATLTFDAISNLSIAGTVAEVDGIGTVSQGVVTYNVKIAFDSNDSRVKPGMSVNAAIITAADTNVLVVPSSAVKTAGSQSYVQELGQKYPAAQASAGVTSATAPVNVPVTVGLSDDTQTEIVSGLSAGDQVITKTTTTTGGSSASAASTRSTATAATARGGFGGGAGGGAVFRAL